MNCVLWVCFGDTKFCFRFHLQSNECCSSTCLVPYWVSRTNVITLGFHFLGSDFLIHRRSSLIAWRVFLSRGLIIKFYAYCFTYPFIMMKVLGFSWCFELFSLPFKDHGSSVCFLSNS